jgi:FKBP-type peptidyl-prolyl cis-trans isomerase
MRRIAAALLVPLTAAVAATATIALAGCGSSAPAAASANASVTVSGNFGKAPAVKIPAQRAGSSLRIKTEIQGSGPALPAGDSTLANFAIYIWSGKTHKLLDSTFTSAPQMLPAQLPLPGLAKAVSGQKMGSRVLAVLPPKYAYGKQGNSGLGIKGTDTTVWVIDLIKSFSATASASGTQVSSGGGKLPKITATAGTAPTVKIPSTSPPKTLIAKTLIQGTGPAVANGQELVTQYVGVNWRTGKTFDSSWSRRAPFAFVIAATPPQTILGWNKGLVGKKVGSRILLSIPSADGYGKKGFPQAAIKGTDTLVFVVDILGAVSPGA